ncbi:MAG: hypothetical protein ACRCX2_30815, partial [Paraclostridium sp.]
SMSDRGDNINFAFYDVFGRYVYTIRPNTIKTDINMNLPIVMTWYYQRDNSLPVYNFDFEDVMTKMTYIIIEETPE